jgi:hypothetical protein
MNIKSISFLGLASLFLLSSAQAAITVSYSPPLTVGTIERFSVSDSGTDVTSNYTIQSIAPDAISGYTPAKSATAFRASQAGSFLITFVSNVDSSTFTNTAAYTAAPAYIQLISGAGQSASTGSALAQPIKVQVSDTSGNTISGASVTWSITGSGGTFSSPSISDGSGIASTTLTMSSTPGTYSVTATAGSVSTGELIQETSNPTTNQLSNLTFQTQPSPLAQQSIIFPSQPVLSLTNGSGAAYNISTPVSVTAFKNSSCTTPASGNLGGITTINSSSGTATFTNLTYANNEAIFLKFTAGSLNVCSNQVSISQPATNATKLALNFTPTSSYTQMPFNLLVNVTDSAGNIIVAANSSISLTAYSDASCSTAATGTLSNGAGISAYQGQALFNSLIYSNVETIYIKAISTGLTSVCSSGIQIKGNPIFTPTTLAFYSAPTSEFAGQLFGVQPFTYIKNGVGSIYQGSTSIPITIAAYTDSSCSTAATGTLSGGTVNNTVFGVGSFTNLGYSNSGTIYLGISSPGLTSACSSAITMNATAASLASKLKFSTTPSTSAVLNTLLTTQPSIEVDDSAGSIVSGAQGYIALNWYTDSTCSTPAVGAGEANSRIVNGTAQFSFIASTSVGVYYLRGSYNNISPICSSAITVTSGACTASQHPNSTTFSCDANIKDCSSSILNSSVATATWTGSAYGSCSVTSCNTGFNKEGNLCLSAIAVSPASASVLANQTIQLTASGGDSTYTWSSDTGSVNTSGLFTAPASGGTSIVTVTDSHGFSGTAAITVAGPLSMTPSTLSMKANATTQMLVSGGSMPYSYSATGGSVSLIETFKSTGTMTTQRKNHTASMLANGKVLVVGGIHSGVYLATAEIYDPATGLFTATTGSMITARGYHTASVLANGKVLIAGGNGVSGSLSSAEIYDPSTGLFTGTGSMSDFRYYHTASVLANGKVLMVGGYGSSGISSTAELYDPGTGLFTLTGSTTDPRYQHTATVLKNGKVLIAGGNGSPSLSSVEIYNPSTELFTSAGSMLNGRFAHSASVLSNGKVLIVGGYSSSNGYLTASELYDPSAGTFTATGSSITPRYQHTASVLNDGRVLITGGVNLSGNLAVSEVYDPSAGLFGSSGSMTTARYNHGVVLLANGKILVIGGYNDSIGDLSSAELFFSGALFTAGTTLGAATVTVTDSVGGSVTSNFTIIPPAETQLATKALNSPAQVSGYLVAGVSQGSFVQNASSAVLTKVNMGIASYYRQSYYNNGPTIRVAIKNSANQIVATSTTVIDPSNNPYFSTTVDNTTTAMARATEQMIQFDFSQASPYTLIPGATYQVYIMNYGSGNQIWGFQDWSVFGLQ